MRHRVSPGFLALLLLAFTPGSARAQVDIAAGVLVVPGVGVEGSQVGPAVSLGAYPWSGAPVFLEASAARIDFVSLGQAYHNNHLLLALGIEWVPRTGSTMLGFRLGLGAHRESQVVESDPPRGGGTNWAEMVQPAVSVVHELSQGRELVVSISDAVLGPFYAVLDPQEYGVTHRLRLMLGLRF